MKKYYPADSLKSPKFCGVRTFMRLPFVREIEGNGDEIDLAFVGIPFDTGGSYRTGQRFGPAAIRDASVLVRRYNPIQKIEIFEHISGIDYGDLSVVPGNIEETYRLIEEELTPLVRNGIVPIGMGGDHSITLGELALHLDTDYAGRNAVAANADQLRGRYEIRNEPPPVGKDCNDYLMHLRHLTQEKTR